MQLSANNAQCGGPRFNSQAEQLEPFNLCTRKEMLESGNVKITMPEVIGYLLAMSGIE